MARTLRIQFPRAIYHVINRSNYRRYLGFATGDYDRTRPDLVGLPFSIPLL